MYSPHAADAAIESSMDDAQTTSSAQHAARSVEALRELRERTRAVRSAQRDHVSQLERQLTEQLDQLAAEISKQASADAAAESARLHDELDEARTAWDSQRTTQEAELADLRRQLDALREDLDKRSADQDERDRTLEEREKSASERDKDIATRDEQLAERERQIAAAEAEAESQRQEIERERQAWAAEQAQREQDRGGVEAALAEAREQLERTQQQTDDAVENESLQHKFELALQDVRRLRGRVAELEGELARRPEDDETDSAELVHLRAERDALAERVEQLEREPQDQSQSADSQEMADLQRRFELAVEDVRELKTKNAQLEQQLAQVNKQRPAAAAAAAAGDGMDWESQKRRLLESLESEGESNDPARRKEQATIEGTIRITDEVVASKDDEIASLRAQLEALRAAGGKVGVERERELAIARLIDEDEIIEQHRKRVAQLEREIEEKLRAAELELSVERAKIARQQAELAESRLEIESHRKSGSTTDGETPTSSGPRRRWLSKLGLSNDDDEK